jgi:hypothetical protein
MGLMTIGILPRGDMYTFDRPRQIPFIPASSLKNLDFPHVEYFLAIIKNFI